MDNGIKFEQDYLFRNYRNITTIPDVALTEFISNSWDAGAYNVDIKIPSKQGQIISIMDDGIGMTDKEFHDRWMTLNYNRKTKQGEIVVFPNKEDKTIRRAYGKNGIGRHGMLCFSDSYWVETWKNGTCNKYKIEVSSGESPYKITEHKEYKKDGHGTIISAIADRHIPNVEDIKEILSVRFLYDPRFFVKINGEQVELLEHKDVTFQEKIKIFDFINLDVIMINSTKTAVNNHQHGIAFWVGGKLIGNPSWSYNNIQFVDGRLKFAKKYTIVVKTDDIAEYVLPDWSGFIDNLEVNNFFLEFKKHVDRMINVVMREQIENVQMDVIKTVRDKIERLSISGRRDVARFVEDITLENPIINPDFLRLAVETIAKIEKVKNGELLLEQLNKMNTNSLNKLSDILKDWDVEDICLVLDEIDKRIVVIEALERLSNDESTDELNTIHPLILNSRWLFGAEFDSPMFASNRTLSTIVKTLFKEEEYDLSQITNPRKRPDIVCLKKFSFKAVCVDKYDVESKMMKPDQILIIEVKRGGFEITPEEVMQAEQYVRQIKKSVAIHSGASITAYVVGSKLGDVDASKNNDSGRIFAITFDQLIETSKGKLFKLKDSLQEHYNSISTENIVDKALKLPQQLTLDE